MSCFGIGMWVNSSFSNFNFLFSYICSDEGKVEASILVNRDHLIAHESHGMLT